MFVRNSIVSVNGKPPDCYITEVWFKHIIGPIRKWYDDKYGVTATRRKKMVSNGIVLFNGAFYKLEIPLRRLVPKGELTDLIFPKEVLSFEKELFFANNPPNLLEESPERKSFEQLIRVVVNLTRSISNNIVTAQFKRELCHELLQGIEAHIEKAVADILSNENGRFLSSYWELHLAIEKSIKIIIAQANKEFPLTHELQKLWSILNEIKPGLVSQEQINKFPGEKEVISYRYGKGPNLKKTDVYSNYMEALGLLDILTYQFARRVRFQNTVFVLKKLPWQK
jgi:HEPN domain-containing protein